MNCSCCCFPCFSSKNESCDYNDDKKEHDLPIAQPLTTPQLQPPIIQQPPQVCTENRKSVDSTNDKEEPFDADGVDKAKVFTFRELASATKNFRQGCLLGEGGFGRVFRGTLHSSGQVVAVRKLDRSGTQGSKEFEVEVLMLSLLHHPNLVRLVGYCADGDQRLLVYEYMPSGSLENHLFDIPASKKPLNWTARMKIASGIAQGLEYLHEKANPPIIYRDLKSSSILLDETNNPRLSDYGLMKLVQNGSKMHLSPKMAASGYCAPEYERNGELTLKSDIYSFGVVILELITGRRALDFTRPIDEQSLVTWAQPIFRDPKRFPDMADPLLKGEYPITSLNQVVGVAAMCLQEEPMVRPMISDVVAALSFLSLAPPNAPIPPRLAPILSGRVESLSQHGSHPNLEEGSISRSKMDVTTSESEEEEQKIHPNNDDVDDEQDSDESSDSDGEDNKSIADKDQNESVKKLKESCKWSSSSRRKSKAESEGKRTTSLASSSSYGSLNSSLDTLSLRCDSSTYPERNFHSVSRQHKSHDNSSGSSSDEESSSGSFKSNTRFRSINSRNKSNKSRSNSNKSSSNKSPMKRQVSSEKSSDMHSRKYDGVEISMENEELGIESDDDEDESDFVYSRYSSSVDSDYGDHSRKHEN